MKMHHAFSEFSHPPANEERHEISIACWVASGWVHLVEFIARSWRTGGKRSAVSLLPPSVFGHLAPCWHNTETKAPLRSPFLSVHAVSLCTTLPLELRTPSCGYWFLCRTSLLIPLTLLTHMNLRVSIYHFYRFLSIIIHLRLIDMKDLMSSETQLTLNYTSDDSEILSPWNQNSQVALLMLLNIFKLV